MKFSQRIGFKPYTKAQQIESIDDDLRNGLWNVLYASLYHEFREYAGPSSYLSDEEVDFSHSLWHDFFKLNIKSIPSHHSSFYEHIEKWFFKALWYEVYDIIEYYSNYAATNDSFNLDASTVLIDKFNIVLEREFSGFRFINDKLAPITNSLEIDQLNEALSLTDTFTALKGSNIHLKTALQKLSDRHNPDYRNSIKESISAVESLAKLISGKPKDSLGASLDRIKGSIKLHEALERGFKQIYGYTSDEGGIRHSLMEDPNCDFEDAKFMLISCSAFINYLIVKANKAGIIFQ